MATKKPASTASAADGSKPAPDALNFSGQTSEELIDALVQALSERTGAWLQRALTIHAELGAREGGFDALGADVFAQAMQHISALVQAAANEIAEHAGTERARQIFLGGVELLTGLAGVFREDSHPAQYAAACSLVVDFRDAGKKFVPGAGIGLE